VDNLGLPRPGCFAGDAPMKIASWNVNSVKVRLPHLIAFLEAAKPDVSCSHRCG
jgi:hypothetical protein